MTSLLAGCTIFGVLGNLAHQIGTDDIGSVVKGGGGLAFISYPDAIAKFDVLPQAFAVLFFFMLFVLGVGSNVAQVSTVMTAIRDKYHFIKNWQIASVISVIGFSIGLIYVTPGGQFILNLVDFYGATFIAFVMATAELVAVCWIYGVDRLCNDTKFMLGIEPNRYWRVCWKYVTPIMMIVILIYSLASLQPLKYHGEYYPNAAYAIGWCISAIGIAQLPIWAIYTIINQKGDTLKDKIVESFRPLKNWGPKNPVLLHKYQELMASESDIGHHVYTIS